MYNKFIKTCCLCRRQNAYKPGGLATGTPCHGTVGTVINPPLLTLLYVHLNTSALKISRGVKNSLYRKWLKTKNPSDDVKYKQYRNTFEKIACEAENAYYKQLFDSKSNSIKNVGKS